MQPKSDLDSQTAAPSSPALTPAQLHALFDILAHFETYDEVEKFKHPGTISRYGHPFVANPDADDSDAEYASESSAPLLATLLRTVVLPLPGVSELPPQFWSVRLQGILAAFAEAELSESYDKGALGTRRTLAAAASVVHESVTRGCLGGFPKNERRGLDNDYDPAKAEDLVAAWEAVVGELVYGDLIDELFDCAIEKDTLEDHSPAVRTAVDYIIIHMATFIHYIVVLSPEGQYLLKLVENIHKLIPYSVIKQTLRIGNAATMISGMMRLLLAKMTVGALTNWVGWTQNADDGMNLLQRIISMVLSWDCSEFRKSAVAIEKAKGGPSREHLSVIQEYIELSRGEHEALRTVSAETPQSIVAAIFANTRPDLLKTLSGAQHAQCLEYYSAALSVRDREQITKVLCRQNPDHFTQALRDAVGSFEPIIRTIHEQVDIREHLSAGETFINDFISTSKPKKRQNGVKESEPADLAPSVEDYVRFLQRNRQLLYNWLHQVAASCPDIRESFRTWAKSTVKGAFAQDGIKPEDYDLSVPESSTSDILSRTPQTKERVTGAGDMSPALENIFRDLSVDMQKEVIPALDAYAAYLTELEELSLNRMQRVLDNLENTGSSVSTSRQSSGVNTPKQSSGASTPQQYLKTNTQIKARSMCGPGMFISRWQAILNRTAITPASPTGAPRSGKDVKGSSVLGKTGASAPKDSWDSESLARQAEADVPRPPDVDAVVRALGPAFRAVAVEMARRQKQ